MQSSGGCSLTALLFPSRRTLLWTRATPQIFRSFPLSSSLKLVPYTASWSSQGTELAYLRTGSVTRQSTKTETLWTKTISFALRYTRSSFRTLLKAGIPWSCRRLQCPQSTRSCTFECIHAWPVLTFTAGRTFQGTVRCSLAFRIRLMWCLLMGTWRCC